MGPPELLALFRNRASLPARKVETSFAAYLPFGASGALFRVHPAEDLVLFLRFSVTLFWCFGVKR